MKHSSAWNSGGASAARSKAHSPDQLVQRALALHRQGEAQQAKALYEAALAAAPRHFDTLHLLGILEFQSGAFARAAVLFNRALQVNASVAAAHSNLGLALHRLGQHEQARRSFDAALALQPSHVDALNNLGNLLRDTHQLQDALACFERALHFAPEHPQALNNRGNTLRDLLRPEDALASLDAALTHAPHYAEAHYNRGNVLQDLRQHEAAVHSYQQALRLKPGMAEAAINLGNALQELALYAAALGSYQQALRLAPDNVMARLNQAGTLQKLHEPEAALASYAHILDKHPQQLDALVGRSDALRALNRPHEALACVELALQLEPGHAPALNSRGVTRGMLGQLDAARCDHRRAIELAPAMGLYYRNLLQTGPLAADDPQLLAMLQLLQAPHALLPIDRLNLHFACGDALDPLGRHDEAFAHYLQANALQRQRTAYNEAATLALLDWYRTTFTAPFMQARQAPQASPQAPVFVIGMPRCGSTLIEQILASHPAMEGGGERRDFIAVVMQHIAQHQNGRSELHTLAALNPTQLRQIGDDYLARIGAPPDQAGPAALPPRRWIDKSLLNFIHVGLIHLALPNARFIHSRRAPLATCLSCFSKLFDDVPFSYDLGELGRYYRAYDDLMAHWRAVLPPGVMLEVQYEELVDDFDTQARRMVQHCGFEWDEACRAFHRNPRAVATSSLAQVRRPLYRHALTRWQPAAHLLQPLLDGLGPALAPAATRLPGASR